MSRVYVTLDGYVVRRVTEKSIAVAKVAFGASGDLTWLPRSMCEDGENLDIGDTDISVVENIAEERGLDF